MDEKGVRLFSNLVNRNQIGDEVSGEDGYYMDPRVFALLERMSDTLIPLAMPIFQAQVENQHELAMARISTEEMAASAAMTEAEAERLRAEAALVQAKATLIRAQTDHSKAVADLTEGPMNIHLMGFGGLSDMFEQMGADFSP